MNRTYSFDTLDPEYAAVVAPLLGHGDVMSMDGFRHHDRTALTHSLAVSTKAYRMAKRLGYDAVSTARGALLHDFFLYDWRDGENLKHPTSHAGVALRNARARFDLNPIEQDIILAHMWPIDKPFYSYKESALVSVMDKIVSIGEVSHLFWKTALSTISSVAAVMAVSSVGY